MNDKYIVFNQLWVELFCLATKLLINHKLYIIFINYKVLNEEGNNTLLVLPIN